MVEAAASHKDPSVALQHFKQAMDSMMKNYTVLNPRDGLLCGSSGGVLQSDDGRPVVQEFIRGGIVRAWVAWEAYISEIFEEAFWKAIELDGTCGFAAEPIRLLKKKWPQSDTQDCLAKLNVKEESWEDKIKDHLEKTLRLMVPVFNAGRQIGINKAFSRLFDKKIEDVPSIILTMLPPKYKGFTCPFQFSDNTSALLVIKEKDGIRDVLRLYYGMRCVLTHGCVEKTLKGCLREFPEEPDDLKVQGFNSKSGDPTNKVSKYLTHLYHKIVAEKKNVLIEYADLVNMTRFLKFLAIQLMFVLKLWFRTSFGVDIWLND